MSSEDRTGTSVFESLSEAHELARSNLARLTDAQASFLRDGPTQKLLRDMQERHASLLGAVSSFQAEIVRETSAQQIFREMQDRHEGLARAAASATGFFDDPEALSAARRLEAWSTTNFFETRSVAAVVGRAFGAMDLLDRGSLDQALGVARLTEAFALPTALEVFRTSEESLAHKLLHVPDYLSLHERPEYLEAFTRVSAVSDALAQSSGIHSATWGAVQGFALTAMPTFDTLADYRGFLDAAGLILPRWPRVRLLTAAEKRRRIKARLRANAEPTHVKKAKSLVHGYERVFREIIDAAMAEAYGEDWPDARLPLCGCNDLLGKWRRRGGDVLDHADYAHYERIMGHPEHFETLFEVAFDDPGELVALLNKAGRLRAASHHAREFTPEDLGDLRLTWRTLEAWLVALTDSYVVEPSV